MKKKIVLVIMTLLLLVGCSKDKISNNNIKESNGKIKVSASTYPMYYIANEIGKNNIDLNILIPIGVDPHEYELSLKQTKEIENTDLLLYNGSGLENFGEKIESNMKEKNKAVINASNYVELLDIEDSNEEEDHHHGNKDPHIWLDPTNVEKIAKEFKEELKKLDEKNSDTYEENYLELSSKLEDLDQKYKNELKNRESDTILVSHMAFGYLANRYGLEQIAVTGISPHAEPSPKSISRLIDLTEEKNINYIFFEVLSSPKSVEMVAKEANLEVLTLNPLGGISKEQFNFGVDYIDIMEDNLDNLKKALVK